MKIFSKIILTLSVLALANPVQVSAGWKTKAAAGAAGVTVLGLVTWAYFSYNKKKPADVVNNAQAVTPVKVATAVVSAPKVAEPGQKPTVAELIQQYEPRPVVSAGSSSRVFDPHALANDPEAVDARAKKAQREKEAKASRNRDPRYKLPGLTNDK